LDYSQVLKVAVNPVTGNLSQVWKVESDGANVVFTTFPLWCWLLPFPQLPETVPYIGEAFL